MRCLSKVYNGKESVWARNLMSNDEKFDNESGKTNNKRPQGYISYDRISLFFCFF